MCVKNTDMINVIIVFMFVTLISNLILQNKFDTGVNEPVAGFNGTYIIARGAILDHVIQTSMLILNA